MTFLSQNARTGEYFGDPIVEATVDDIDRVMEAAAGVASQARGLTIDDRVRLLHSIADEVTALGESFLELVDEETALGLPRLRGELGRAVNGARLFADWIREGSWVDARIDQADASRQPIPKPDLRMMLRPIGPVVVFGASNFPLAISVVGTDTVAALAAGCAVVVKAHPAHPLTCEALAAAVSRAIEVNGLPGALFQMVQGKGNGVGHALVQHPRTEVVAFTGSLQGGAALAQIAQERERPIPVYAEMGSLNPVFLGPRALADHAEQIADGFVQSLTLGTGQFCTNPALVMGIDGEGWSNFRDVVTTAVQNVTPTTMLHRGIHAAYEAGVAERETLEGMTVLARATEAPASEMGEGAAIVLETDVDGLQRHWATLKEEVFGPMSILVRCQSLADFARVSEMMEGSLSATVHAAADEWDSMGPLLEQLETKVGRLVVNGFPTGLEVCSSMQHGGPYPASTHAGFTSVGQNAILRFVRPVSYQNMPQACLPAELKDENPRGIWRMVDGARTQSPVTA